MRAGADGGGCFPTGRHYPGIAHLLRVAAQGLAQEFDAQVAVADLTLVSIDTETTGINPEEDRVVEVAGVIWKNGAIVARHSWIVNPGCPIPKEAFDVHGISDDDVRDQPGFAQIAEAILDAFTDAVPVAYNAEFDRDFLHAELNRAGVDRDSLPPAARRGVEWIDPLTWARELQKEEKSKSLGEVAARLGVALETAHRATDDAQACVEVLSRFLSDTRVPSTYAAFIQEQRRLARAFRDEQARWRRPS